MLRMLTDAIDTDTVDFPVPPVYWYMRGPYSSNVHLFFQKPIVPLSLTKLVVEPPSATLACCCLVAFGAESSW